MGAAVRHHTRAGLVTVKGYPTDWLTSALGQTRKYSRRAHRVRLTPGTGLKSDIAGGPFRAKSGSREPARRGPAAQLA
jgi:hypothetical protein